MKDITSMNSKNKAPLQDRGVKLTFSLLLISLTIRAQVTFHEPAQLTKIDTLPDILTFIDGSKVKIKENWSKRRNELKNLIQFYEYGFLPPAPGNVTSVELATNDSIFKGKGVYKMTRLNMGSDNKISFLIHAYLPKKKGPFPVVLDGDLCWRSYKTQIEKFVQKGYAVIEFDRTDLDMDNDNRLDGFQAFYPGDYGTLAVLARACHRVIDYVVSQPNLINQKSQPLDIQEAGNSSIGCCYG
jgi:endo-1,4-beta-xylanase